MLLSASLASAAPAPLRRRRRLPPQKHFASSNPNPNLLIRSSALPPHKPQTPPKKPPPAHSLPSSASPAAAAAAAAATDALETTAEQEQFLRTLFERSHFDKLALLLQYGAVLASVEAPTAWAVTGNNNEDDLVTTLISAGVIAFFYFLVAPPIIMNWMRLRWYKRKFLEMFFQFMCVFIFFPGLMLWAPFLNFRKFPRDPTMKYPWSTPKDDVPLYRSR